MGLGNAGASKIFVTEEQLKAIRQRLGDFDSKKEVDFAAIVSEVTGVSEESLNAEPFVLKLEGSE